MSGLLALPTPRHFSTTSVYHKSGLPRGAQSQILAQQECSANRDISDSNAQARFYALLMASHHPGIVVSRYETAGVARNRECDKIYISALKSLGDYEKANSASQQLSLQTDSVVSNSTGHLVDESNGSSGASAISSSALYNKGTGSDPIHVTISESMGSIIMRWIRWTIPMAIVGYVAYNSISLISDSSILKDTNGDLTKNNFADGPNGTKSTVKFTDVHGVDEARAELEEIVDFLKDPSKFTGLGGKLPKGVLLTGPPGTGKTLLARAVAGEAGVPFYFMSGSEFDELYVGVGAKRIRQLFDAARSNSPAIVFIDELDAIGGKRSKKDYAYSKQTLNQLLVELDGFNQSTGIIFIAATNFPETLDAALTRPGRFDKIVHVELPDVRGRVAILKHHMSGVETSSDVDPSVLARGTSGFSGADLMNLVNQAAIHASQQKAVNVNMDHFEWAKDKILLGAAKKSMVLTPEIRLNTAYHEAGHALMALYTQGATSLYKATILPRGRALGITFQLPDMDKYEQTRRELYASIDVCMGGKIAEELIRGPDNVSSGCSSDLQKATAVARNMVTRFGMSEVIGPIDLGSDWSTWSPHIKSIADEEVRKLLSESEKRTRILLTKRRLELDRLAKGLVEFETLDKNEIEDVCNGKPLKREKFITNEIIESETLKDPNSGEPIVGIMPNPSIVKAKDP
ncbi:ATP-dependent metallopeptidase Hfl [Nadsonia fulvescens var. elongata DSM 6958]|uniref:ATP-dependent metallopeptidase Hfl n=1 Tax=Nadsonia fulvescens var. elongata DSM 6958 TaxID=857566 RepID=A0A1E3PM48_9ASCO|nr:ATP-dependent metallopeptidase Hfl [Nadsonia fulvescens var. elongata DSM 6958]